MAPIITLPNRRHALAYTKILTPEVIRRQRLQQAQQTHTQGQVNTSGVKLADSNNIGQSGGRAAAPNNDFLQWLLARSLTNLHKSENSLSPDERDPEIICARLLHTNFAAVHTTSFIGTNAILDILAAPLAEGVVETLRAEAVETMDADVEMDTDSDADLEAGPVLDVNNSSVDAKAKTKTKRVVKMWSKKSLTRMHYLDSALRESSRRASIIGVGINHKVVAPGGITTPEGIYLPEGSMVAVHSWGLHNDEKVYSRAGTYRPFRFVEMKEEIGRRRAQEGNRKSGGGVSSVTGLKGGNRDGKEEKEDGTDGVQEEDNRDGHIEKADERAHLDKAHLQFVATSPTYLGFGHGRHACPGRFFAANELKLLIAYLLTRYDIQMVLESDGSVEESSRRGAQGAAQGYNDCNISGNGKGIRPECFWAGPNHVPPMGAKVRVRRREM